MQLMPFVKQLSVCASLQNNFKIHDFTLQLIIINLHILRKYPFTISSS